MSALLVLLVGLSLPAILSFVDCLGREESAFEGGAADRRGWLRWLAVALFTSWIGVGYAVVLGYYYTVVRRNSPSL